MSTTRTKAKTPFDKYFYYKEAVQGPENDVVFLRDTYRELRGKAPVSLREDFCGTFSICCEWAKLNSKHQAFGVDLDPEPIQYGKTHYLPELSASQQARVQIQEQNVLSPDLPKTDIVCAMNFSHFIFKDRAMMKSYLMNCYKTLNPNGVMIMDCFGGSKCQEANEEHHAKKGFTYYWDQESFDPITNHAVFHIHFRPKGQKKIEKAFSYDWRMWTIPEIREIMSEADFKRTWVYWEGTEEKTGEGNGEFTRMEKGEECQAWIAYVVGER